MSKNAWRRVSRQNLCPICRRPDWCLIAADRTAAICARQESPRRIGEAGWLHRLKDNLLSPQRWTRTLSVHPTTSTHDLGRHAEEFRRAIDPLHLASFAHYLGLTVESLHCLRIGWADRWRAWSFPMINVCGHVLGIRLRRPDGRKFAVKGGREGLFLPSTVRGKAHPLLICEGPTDAAALLDMGFRTVVGRPSCTGGIKLLIEVVKWLHRPEVVIVADNDQPGQRGAAQLASVLMTAYATVRVILPPAGIKDVREWLRQGGTRQDLDKAIQAVPARRLVICRRQNEQGR